MIFYDTKQTTNTKRVVNDSEQNFEEKPIMIEITLAEYRGLLFDNFRFENENARLQDEIIKLNCEIDCLRDKVIL